MTHTLKGRKVLITGGARGLGFEIAQKFAREGADIAINFVSNSTAAAEAEARISADFGVKTFVCQGDIGVAQDCEDVVKKTTSALGGLDIIISNAAWTRFSDFKDLYALSEDEWDKCYDTNVKGSLHLFRAAHPTFNINPDGGVFIYTASTAGKSISGSSLAYSVTKAAGLQLMKCLAQTQGPKIRVNSVLPGLLLTEWGNQYSKEFIEKWQEDTPLNSIPELSNCADTYVAIAKNPSMTGQEIQIGKLSLKVSLLFAWLIGDSDCGWLLAH